MEQSSLCNLEDPCVLWSILAPLSSLFWFNRLQSHHCTLPAQRHVWILWIQLVIWSPRGKKKSIIEMFVIMPDISWQHSANDTLVDILHAKRSFEVQIIGVRWNHVPTKCQLFRNYVINRTSKDFTAFSVKHAVLHLKLKHENHQTFFRLMKGVHCQHACCGLRWRWRRILWPFGILFFTRSSLNAIFPAPSTHSIVHGDKL